MKKYVITSLLLAAAAATPAAYASPETADTLLTLEQCQTMALANNAAMRKAARDTEAARQLRREAFTKYFPEISAAGFGFRTHNYVLQYNALNLLRIELIRHGVMAGVQALQPIFMGGQIVNGNQLAKVGEAVARLQQQQTADQVGLTTEKYFWQLTSLKATRNTLVTALAMLDTLDRQITVAVDAGVATRNDLLKVQLKRNDYRAKMVDLDNGIKLCRMVLSQYVGAPIESPVDIASVVPDSLPPYPIDLRVNPSEALPGTVDYKLLENQVRAKKLEKRIEVGKNLPQIAAGAGWFYHNVLEQSNNFGAIMLTVNIPITGWWGGSHAIKRKSLELENARTDLQDLGRMLEINMQNKWDELTAAHRKMEIAREAIGQSAENLRLNRLYYEAGTAAIGDLLDAETLHREACDQYTGAYGEFRVARAEYLDAIGR